MRRALLAVGAALFWLTAWQLTSMFVGQELLVPAPAVVLATLARLATDPGFWLTTGASLSRVLLGFVAGVSGGTAAAVLTTRSRLADAVLSPALRVVRAAPVASFVILALVWIPAGRLAAFISFLMVVPVVWDNVAAGLRGQDPELLEMAAVFGLGRWQTLRRVRVPSVLPFFATACTTGMGLAWKSGVAAEVIGRPPVSIGGQLQDARIYLETPAVFAWTITVVALSLALERLLRLGMAQLTRSVPDPSRRREEVSDAVA